MKIFGSTTSTDSITSSTTRSRLDSVIEKVVGERGYLSAFRNIASAFAIPAFKIFSLLLKYKGDEKKIQEKLLKKSQKLIKKLEKYSLTSQYNELTKDIQVSRPLLVVKILRRLGGDVEAVRDYILRTLHLGTSRSYDDQITEQYPDFESIYESLLRKGISVPAALILNLLIKLGGSLSRVEEALLGRKTPSILSELFNEGRTLIRSLRENILGGEDTSTRRSTVSPVSSSTEVVRTVSENVEDEVYVQRLIEGNRFLISNGFTNVRENILVLRRFGGDSSLALRTLVLSSVRGTMSEDFSTGTSSGTGSLTSSSLSSSNSIYNNTYGTSYSRSSGSESSTSSRIPLSERYLSTTSSIIPTISGNYIPESELDAILASSSPYLIPLSNISRLGNTSSSRDTTTRITPSRVTTERVSDSRTVSSSSGITSEVGDVTGITSGGLSRGELESILRRMMELIVTLNNTISTSTSSTSSSSTSSTSSSISSSTSSSSSSSGVNSRIDSSVLRGTKKCTRGSGTDSDVEVLVSKTDSKMKI